MASTGPPPHAILLDKFNQVLAFRSVAAFGTLGVADHLGAHGPSTAAAIASALRLHPSALFRVLRACANIGAVTQSSPLEAEASNVPGSLRNVLDVLAQPGHWQAFHQHIESSIKTGQAATHAAYGSDIWAYYQVRPQEQATFAAADLSGSAIAAILAAISLENASVIVDVGGLLAGVLTKAPPQARGILFDLPHVIKTAPVFFDSVPQGDVYLLKHVLHDWSDDESVAILKTFARHAAKGARVLIIELVLSSTVEQATGAGGLLSPSIFMDVNMLSLCTGRERTAEQYATLYTKAGIRFTKVTPTPSPYAIVRRHC